MTLKPTDLLFPAKSLTGLTSQDFRSFSPGVSGGPIPKKRGTRSTNTRKPKRKK
jgi:hypothetical protein